jgi:hypothetical protein
LERWAADLTESHVSYPWLLSFRSPYPLRSWVLSLLADRLVAAPARWSGERRTLRLPADELVLPARPRHRSLDDPESRTLMLPPRAEPFRRSETPT